MLCHGGNRALGLALKNPLPVACNTACMRQLPLAAKQTIRIVGLHQRNAMGLAIVPRSSPLESSEAGMDFGKVAELEKQKREVEKAIMQAVNEKQPVAVVQALETVLKSTTADLERLQPSPGASGQAAGDAGKVYSNITLYILSQGQQGYDKLEKKKATRNQLQRIWKECSYALVARVKSKPAQLLTPATCPDAADMGSVELEDGAHLALVVHQPLNFMGQLVDKINKNTEKGEELQGFKDNNVSEQENTAAAWALKQIKTEPGAQIFCFKKLSQKIGKAVVNEVELDGVACSDTSCNIVERKQQFRHKEVLELIAEINTLKILIDNKAPNTDLLQGKELRFFMMAGSWPTDDTDEQAAVRELMMQHRIQPVMPDGSGYHISWGCNLQTPDQAKRIQNFRDKMGRVKQPKPAALQR